MLQLGRRRVICSTVLSTGTDAQTAAHHCPNCLRKRSRFDRAYDASPGWQFPPIPKLPQGFGIGVETDQSISMCPRSP
jgi:hypothetical protein